MNAYHNIIHDSMSAFYVRIYAENNIHHNIIYNMGTAFHLVAENQQGDRRSYIYNNTVYQCSALLSTGPDDAGGWRRIVDLRDNIYYDTITTGTSNAIIILGRWSGDLFDISDWTSSNNDYYYLAGRTPFLIHQNVFISWENAGAYLSDPVMYDFDPQFVDGPNHDFHLQPTSPAINAASDGADLGALDTGTVLLPPEQAENPSPPDTDTDVSPSPALSWTGGTRATSHDVYFGTDFNDVNDAVLPAGDVDGNGRVNWDDVKVLGEQWLQNPVGLSPSADLNDDNGVNCIDFAIIGDTWTRDISEVFKGNQTAVTFEPATLDYETTYYWRIDEINAAGITKGNVWSFTTRADTGLDPNLVGYWQLENNADDSAGDNDGTVYGAVATTGKIEQALSFDEIDDYINVPDFDYTNSSDEFSLSFWFKIDDVAGTAYQYMFSHGNYATSNSLNVYFSETDEGAGGEELRTNITLSDSTSWQPATASIFADGQWHLYTLTVSSIGGATIYIDENPLLTNTAIKGASLNPSTDIYIGGRCDLNIGRYYGNTSVDDGLIDDVRLYNRVLSPSEVTTLAAGGGL